MLTKYANLEKRMQECLDLYDKTGDVIYLMEFDCICHFFECESFKTYEKIAQFSIENNFKRIFDIGCAFGHQSEVFKNASLNYIGIEMNESNFWNNNKFKYIVKEYPFKIETNPDDLAVSVLCLTWNCYLYEREKTLKKQCEALQRDFKQCLLYIASDKVDFVKQYYKNCKEIDKNIIYFWN